MPPDQPGDWNVVPLFQHSGAVASAPTFGAAFAAAFAAAKPASLTWQAFGRQLGLSGSLLQRLKEGTHVNVASIDAVARKLHWTITVNRGE